MKPPPSAGSDPAILPGAESIVLPGGDVGILLCHGFTGTPQSLRPWARALGDAGFTVRVPRLPGHGTTWQHCNRTTWTQWYDAVLRALDELAQTCRIVVVCGFSMGGSLAVLLAVDRPDVVRGLVLLNPAFCVDDPRMPILPVLRFLLPSVAGISDDRARADGEPEIAYTRVPLHALHSQTKLWRRAVDRIGDVACPVLLMTSTTDHVVPPASAALLLDRVTVAVRHVVLPNSFHVAALDHDAGLVASESIDFVHDLARETIEP